MASLVNNCVFLATSSGTGVFVPASAAAGAVLPAAAGVVDTTKTYRYRAESADKLQWEWGNTVSSGTATSFTRVVTNSSAGGTTTVSFTLAPTVTITVTAADILAFDDAMSLTVAQTAIARANIGVGVHGTTIASASTINLQTATGDVIDVSGTTGINTITLNDGEQRTVRFTGVLVLGTGGNITLPGALASSLTTQANDWAIFRGYPGSLTICMFYQRASLLPFDGSAWTAVSPAVVITGGTATCAMRWKQIGKIVHVSFRISCTATGSQVTSVAMPVACAASGIDYMLVGRETNRTGLMWFGSVNSGGATFGVQTNGISAMNTGDAVGLSGFYEAA